MYGKTWIKRLAIFFFAGCGAFTVSHVLFKLAVGRLYEVDLIHWVALGVAAAFALSTLIFYSKRPLTPRQFKTRILIHAAVSATIFFLLYASGVFQFHKTPNPALEATVSMLISAAVYLGVATSLLHQQKDKATSMAMNTALKRYRRCGQRGSRERGAADQCAGTDGSIGVKTEDEGEERKT